MLEGLSQRFEGVVKRLQGLHKLTEENVSDAMREVRIALLEADVNISVVKDFIANVKSLALGMETIPGVQPGQQIVKIVHENLIQVLGGDTANLNLTGRGSTVILMTGLQGSGKTTTTAKLAAMLKKQGYRPLMVSADVYRPAAIEQLGVLGEQIDVPTIKTTTDMNPEEIGRAALEEMTQLNANVLLVDTAGRLAIDEQMMNELSKLKDILQPKEILFVADSMTGQDAVNTARAFNEQIGMTGVILTKMDGDIRGGAALSIKKVTGTPIKFIGVGEKTSQFEQFHPDRIAGRILGMGDVLSLVEKAQENLSQKDAEKQANKVLTATFNLSDFLQQLKMVRDMGPLDQLMKMIPGLGGALKDAELDEYELIRTEAIINSMTMKERGQPGIINSSRKRRISRGSGVEVQDVNKLLKNFQKSKKMMKNLTKMKKNKGKMDFPFAGMEN
ncbi:MAG TPA: signal recognition particle protein [Nitrospinota bacterium]|nr:signal recognition particle protein [Nitrospinota bacterium]|tara:strand:+ start:163146 stop:164483 length:1338 start_codon:yes stop_codon:yes gene_type:complete